jgi:hypothetical protein
MRRRQYLQGAAGLALPLAAGCTAPGSSDGAELANASFEAGLEGWTVGTDLPTDPNTGGPVAATADVTTETSAEGEQALSLFIDGRQDDGAIWVQQRVDLAGVSRLAVSVHSEMESFNTVTKLAVYAGPDPGRPLTETDFDTSRATETHEGWQDAMYPVESTANGLVAVGIAVVWETEVVRFLDNVRLS